MAHTPGPWAIRTESMAGDILNNHAAIDAPTHYCFAQVVWKMEYQSSSPEREANARLIAAAPEMLEALKAMLPENNVADEHCRPDFTTCEKARAAIAKAEGRS